MHLPFCFSFCFFALFQRVAQRLRRLGCVFAHHQHHLAAGQRFHNGVLGYLILVLQILLKRPALRCHIAFHRGLHIFRFAFGRHKNAHCIGAHVH